MPLSNSASPIPSPCIGQCTLDPATRLCLGCGHHIDEIAGWSSASDEQRAVILNRIRQHQESAPMIDDSNENDYPCAGICRAGPDGYCLGCGRPFFETFTMETPQEANKDPKSKPTQPIQNQISEQ